MECNNKYIEALKREIEDKYERTFRSATDFDRLEQLIKDSGEETLNASTLKRIWGYSKTSSTPRRSTLTVLARILKYRDWEEFVEKKKTPPVESGFLENAVVDVSKLGPGDVVSFQWNPDRSISLVCRGKEMFEVLEQSNSGLRPGDRFRVTFIREGYPIYCKDVVREGQNLGDYIVGETNGIFGFNYKSGKGGSEYSENSERLEES